jgi:hypothetical protein
MVDSISVSYYTHLTLRRKGFDTNGFTFTRDSLFAYYNDGARYFDISRLDIRHDREKRNIDLSDKHPDDMQAEQYYRIFEKYVQEYVFHYYPTDHSLEGDADAHMWFEGLERYVSNGVKHYVPTLDRGGLVKLLTVLIYSVVVGHEQNSLWDHALFMPTLVRQDGSAMTRGEVQCVSNFQFLVCSAINYLLEDFTHLALDEEGARLMRNLQKDLSDLQARMESAGDKHCHLYPATLKSSVAC